MIYFKFLFNNMKKEGKSSFIERVVCFLLYHILPKVNPDFDNRYKDVITWYIEYDDAICCPRREVGVDLNNTAIVMAPYNKNYGYWLDANMTIEDYTNQFNIVYISKKDFEEIWDKSMESLGKSGQEKRGKTGSGDNL